MRENQSEFDLTVLMPCLNEEATVGKCIDTVKAYLDRHNLNGEILVADNGSTDKSVSVAREHGARIIHVIKPGYGRALRAGMKAARGSVIILADCDTTYDFNEMDRLYKPLIAGKYDVMIGDRFRGGIEKGAMPVIHIIGVKFLSLMGRVKYRTDVRDFHCGFRGITREALSNLKFHTTGMEFATEMIAEAVKKGLRIGQIPVSLKKCRDSRQSKLRTIRDGIRHLIYIMRGGSVI